MYFFQDLHLSFWELFKIAFIIFVISHQPRGWGSCAESSHLCWHDDIYLFSLLLGKQTPFKLYLQGCTYKETTLCRHLRIEANFGH